MAPRRLTHFDRTGASRMVDVGGKQITSRIAGIMAAKQVPALVPLCHPVALTKVSINFGVHEPDTIIITARTEAVDRTGVEMEALTAVAAAALTVYDMCKAVDRGMEIRTIRLLEKAGGKSGHYMLKRKREGR